MEAEEILEAVEQCALGARELPVHGLGHDVRVPQIAVDEGEYLGRCRCAGSHAHALKELRRVRTPSKRILDQGRVCGDDGR
jgi:hypothetical protein